MLDIIPNFSKEMYFSESGSYIFIDVAQKKDKWRGLANTTVNLQVP